MVLETLLNILKELPPKDHPTMIFCNTAGNCRALEAWLSSSPEALDLIGGRDKLKPIYRVIPKQVNYTNFGIGFAHTFVSYGETHWRISKTETSLLWSALILPLAD